MGTPRYTPWHLLVNVHAAASSQVLRHAAPGAAFLEDPFLLPEVDARLVAIMVDTAKQLEHGLEQPGLHLEQPIWHPRRARIPFVIVRGFDQSGRNGRIGHWGDRIDPEGRKALFFGLFNARFDQNI